MRFFLCARQSKAVTVQLLFYVLQELQLLIIRRSSESDISNLPLLVLTSDRPHELRGIGAPQTLNQVNMFQNFVRHQFDMPLADDSDGAVEVVKYQMQIASQFFQGPQRGPVHLNLPFREPLTPDFEMTDLLTTDEKKYLTIKKRHLSIKFCLS